MMNPEIKAKWVEALRSGKYKQGLLALRRTTAEGYEYCCLGVLADLLAPGSWESTEGGLSSCHGEDANLADDLASQAILRDNDQDSLIDLNDSDGQSFAQIADYIEAEL